MKTLVIRILKLVGFVYVGLLVMLMALERMMVYPAPPRELGNWAPGEVPVEEVYFQSADGTRLHGWYIRPPHPDVFLLHCHGNGEHIAFLLDDAVRLRDELNAAVFLFDYRGYGRSEGKPDEQGVLADGEAAHRWLTARARVAPHDVVLYGRSLGGAVAVHLAGELGARALVIERTFHSMVDIGASLYWWAPVRWLMHNRYPSIERISDYRGPLLQMHGDEDELVPLASAQKLYAACPSSEKTFLCIPGLGHNDPAPESFYVAARGFLQRTRPESGGERDCK